MFSTVEKRAKFSMNDYLGGGALHTPLQTITYLYSKSYGEVNADGKEHGRGIGLFDDNTIQIGYYENGGFTTGNYIWIDSDGDFQVGERYMKDGKRLRRGTGYYTNGDEEQYDDVD
jgi:hypothetical protein